MEEETIVATEAKSPRASRNAESRAFEGRVAAERPPIVFGAGSRFNLPPSLVKRFKDDGKSVCFVVYSSGNVDQKENYDNAIERGYQPLTASMAPELARQYELSPFGTRDEADQLIRRGGQIAMIRDTEIHEAEDKYYDSENQRQQYMADMYKQADPRYPRPFMDERKRTVGR